jgi:putative transcriptional regulator
VTARSNSSTRWRPSPPPGRKQFHDGSPARITIGVAETLVFATMIVGTLVPIRNLDELHQPVKSRLRELRSDRGWSQGELGPRLQVSRQTVNAIETEKYDPSLPLAFRIARLFGQRIEEVFHPDGR